jgi:hypothetical protein
MTETCSLLIIHKCVIVLENDLTSYLLIINVRFKICVDTTSNTANKVLSINRNIRSSCFHSAVKTITGANKKRNDFK